MQNMTAGKGFLSRRVKHLLQFDNKSPNSSIHKLANEEGWMIEKDFKRRVDVINY